MTTYKNVLLADSNDINLTILEILIWTTTIYTTVSMGQGLLSCKCSLMLSDLQGWSHHPYFTDKILGN